MQKPITDYSNTIIYKITCKDPDVKDLYVGHTTNFVQRKKAHKISCINENADNGQCKLYKIMRENGGWDNWSMDIIHFFSCANQQEARMKEQEFFVSLQATLNSVEPFPTHKCDKDIKQVILVPNTEPVIYLNEQHKTNDILNYCSYCDYSCSKLFLWKQHLLTMKHKNTIANTNCRSKLSCKCGKQFTHKSSRSRHKRICSITNDSQINNTTINNNILEMIKQNQEFKELLIEQNKTIIQLSN